MGAAFKANAFFDNEYSVSINFNLPSSDEEAVLEFNNDNQAFSLAKFFDILDLGVLESIPVISDLLQISIVSAKLHITKPSDSSEISMQEEKVSIYVESIALNSSVTLKQVYTDISFYKTHLPIDSTLALKWLVLYTMMCMWTWDTILKNQFSVDVHSFQVSKR